jgi:NADPH-ferrihemoprotein reductase
MQRRHKFNCKVVDLEDIELEELQQDKLAIFMMATYGEGEPTDNAASFYTLVSNEEGEQDAKCLDGVSFAVFGLGNKQYEHYNSMGRGTDKAVEALGGKRAFAYGEGDDDDAIEDDFDTWKATLWRELSKQFNPDYAEGGAGGGADGAGGESETNAPTLALKSRLLSPLQRKALDNAARASPTGGAPGILPFSPPLKEFGEYLPAKVVCNRELRADDPSGSTKHIEFEISPAAAKQGLTYTTADNLAVAPQNSPETVEAAAKLLGPQCADLDAAFVLEPVAGGDSAAASPFSRPVTVRELLTNYLDLSAPPRKGLLKALAHFAGACEDKARLLHLAGADGKAEYKEWVADVRRSLPEVRGEARAWHALLCGARCCARAVGRGDARQRRLPASASSRCSIAQCRASRPQPAAQRGERAACIRHPGPWCLSACPNHTVLRHSPLAALSWLPRPVACC